MVVTSALAPSYSKIHLANRITNLRVSIKHLACSYRTTLSPTLIHGFIMYAEVLSKCTAGAFSPNEGEGQL